MSRRITRQDEENPHWLPGCVMVNRGVEEPMIDSLFTLYCEDCEDAHRPSRLWVRAEIEVVSSHGPETHHYLECMNCGFRFKSCMEDHMEAVDDEEWSRFVGETGPETSEPSDLSSPIR